MHSRQSIQQERAKFNESADGRTELTIKMHAPIIAEIKRVASLLILVLILLCDVSLIDRRRLAAF